MHEGKQLHRCSFCTACFTAKINYKKHVISVHEKKNLLNPAPKSKKLYQCEFCESKFGIQKFLHAHLKKVHKIDNQQNDGKSPTKNSDDSENVSFVEKKDFVEYQLPFGWKKVGRHRRSGRHPNRLDFYVFGPNGQKFRSNIEIKNYLELNPEVKCDLDVTNTSYVKDVQNYKPKKLPKMKLATINERKQPFGCDICKTYFSSKSDLVGHIESVHGEKDLNEKANESKIFHEQYKQKDGLKRESVHEGKKPIKCPVCEDNFSTIDQMKSHIGSAHFHLW